jgi:hypothetical protein
MMKTLSRMIFALAVTGAASTATAESYLGGSIGKADYNENLWSIEDNQNDTGWKFFGGYHFNRYLGLEAAWVDLGKVDYQGASIETSGVALEGIGSLPIGPMFSIFAKLGAIAWDQDTRKAGRHDDDQGVNPAWGYGGEARFLDKRLGIRIEWERFKSDVDADLISLGASYHF